jgi:hypothetical protein
MNNIFLAITNSSNLSRCSNYLSSSKWRTLQSCLSLFILFSIATPVAADRLYEVTVYNLTHGSQFEGEDCREGQILGLFAFATHTRNVKLFELGETVSPEPALVSESGFPYALAESLQANRQVGATVVVPDLENIPEQLLDGVICAGGKLTVTINAKNRHNFLSLAGMIAPTNDGFVALNGVKLPNNRGTVEYFSPAYDSGSELNDEKCENIPGLPGIRGCLPGDLNTDFHFPFPDPNPEGGPGAGEGYVHLHSGIHGIGDLVPSIWDWNNPVAKVTIRRIRR